MAPFIPGANPLRTGFLGLAALLPRAGPSRRDSLPSLHAATASQRQGTATGTVPKCRLIHDSTHSRGNAR